MIGLSLLRVLNRLSILTESFIMNSLLRLRVASKRSLMTIAGRNTRLTSKASKTSNSKRSCARLMRRTLSFSSDYLRSSPKSLLLCDETFQIIWICRQSFLQHLTLQLARKRAFQVRDHMTSDSISVTVKQPSSVCEILVIPLEKTSPSPIVRRDLLQIWATKPLQEN